MSFAAKAPVQRAHRGQQHTFPIGTICFYTRICGLLTWPMQRNSYDICTRDPSICMSVDAPRRRVIFSVNSACESQCPTFTERKSDFCACRQQVCSRTLARRLRGLETEKLH